MKKIISMICLFPISNGLSAHNPHFIDLFLSGGVSFTQISNSSYVPINDFVTNKYQTNKKTQSNFTGGGGVSYLFKNLTNRPFDFALGIASYYTNFGTVKGVESPFINAGSFDELNYGFQINSTSLLAEGRLIYSKSLWQPYVIGGVGMSWNQFNDYYEKSRNPAGGAAPVPYGFTNHTNTEFAYEIGIGLQRVFYVDTQYNIDYSVSADYRYMNFGNGHLGSMPNQSLINGLSVSNLDAQALLFTLKMSL